MSYTRRKFLSTIVVSASAVALGGLAGCGGSSNTSVTPTPAPTPTPTPKPTGLQPSAKFFPQSLMSGDPKPSSVILWTRVEDSAADDIKVQLQVATDKEFTDVRVDEMLNAYKDNDHCLKVRVTDLDPYTTYYYRFVYINDDIQYVTNVGRTKTAPEASADQAVKFAFVSCQDYVGRYYNAYLSILNQPELDFIVHLGDYIYETTGDPEFQNVDGRSVSFTDTDGAIKIGQGDKAYYSAQSISNYRELYKTYRSDEVLREVHENFPMIAIWDDHEFSDDSWQNVATSLDGAADEKNLVRKQNSERVYFEYMPIDHEHASDKSIDLGNGELAISEDHLFPNTTIYRDFEFGKHVKLLMTDFRTHRPDHLIPEDAFPGTVVMDEATTSAVIAQAKSIPLANANAFVKATFMAYVDIDAPEHNVLKNVLTDVVAGLYKADYMSIVGDDEQTAATKGAAMASKVVTGKLVVDYLNEIIKQLPASLKAIYNIDVLSSDGLERGIAYMTLGKASLFSKLGSRYMVIKDVFDLYAGYKASLDPASQNAFGDKQTAWLSQEVMTSTATWKIMGSSVSFAPLIFDLSSDRVSTGVPQLEGMFDSDAIPDLFKNRFYVNVDHWDGFPQAKAKLINDLLSAAGVITLSGDVHASFVATQAPSSVTGLRGTNYTASSISSGTQGSFIADALAGLATSLSPESAETFAALNPFFNLLTKTATTRDDVPTTISSSELWKHGVGIVTATSDTFTVDLHQFPTQDGDTNYITTSFYDNRETFLEAVEVESTVTKNPV
ncbi:alkaline phosphatase D family protein [Psychrobium sp. MM17-31]|uniref:alkaline phosphatase D family protein n=1 Tax=Psychrobium sp. MM17-31 TaxID=2917758 RepID=UPI001EF4528B|nr:alkaline phosphatase D family protein [Psychrobium sp. MM17-31]MCG7530313.1 alkaline phosphatase D family protein [Psychrobium sp. MM17-31]